MVSIREQEIERNGLISRWKKAKKKKTNPFYQRFQFCLPSFNAAAVVRDKNIVNTWKVKYVIFTEMTSKPTAS